MTSTAKSSDQPGRCTRCHRPLHPEPAPLLGEPFIPGCITDACGICHQTFALQYPPDQYPTVHNEYTDTWDLICDDCEAGMSGLHLDVTERAEVVMTTTARKPRRILTPVTVTARFPSFRSGRVENWAAVSRDGAWKYERIEIAGTPWEVVHVPTGTEGGWYGSLPAARHATADGSAMRYVERVQAHDRGEHDAEPDPRCGRC